MAITRVSSAQMSINVALICYDTFISFAKDIYTDRGEIGGTLLLKKQRRDSVSILLVDGIAA